VTEYVLVCRLGPMIVLVSDCAVVFVSSAIQPSGGVDSKGQCDGGS